MLIRRQCVFASCYVNVYALENTGTKGEHQYPKIIMKTILNSSSISNQKIDLPRTLRTMQNFVGKWADTLVCETKKYIYILFTVQIYLTHSNINSQLPDTFLSSYTQAFQVQTARLLDVAFQHLVQCINFKPSTSPRLQVGGCHGGEMNRNAQLSFIWTGGPWFHYLASHLHMKVGGQMTELKNIGKEIRVMSRAICQDVMLKFANCLKYIYIFFYGNDLELLLLLGTERSKDIEFFIYCF